jgi:hypothetical protein
LELDAVPDAGFGPAFVGHELRGSSWPAWCAQKEAQLAPPEDGEAGGRVQIEGEAEVPGVELGRRRIDVVDDVASYAPRARRP